ncbi:MAG: iron chelate uptake ABC transporter family permease subunit [Planctomycetota bacterium]
MEDLFRLLTLQDSNTRVVLFGTTLLGVASAVIGSFAVLRRRSLMGDAVAHAALPGICVAFLVVGDRSFAALMLGALVFGVLSTVFVAFVKSATRIKEDAAIALAIGGFFGLGMVLSRMIQNAPTGNRAGLDTFIFGKAASMVEGDAKLIALVALVVVLTVVVLYKEFKLLCFDPDFAKSQGWPAFALDLLLMALVCVCTVIGLPAVGVVLMVSMLVIPAVAARFWTDNLGRMLCFAAFFGGLAGALGTAMSATVPAPGASLSRGWPTGPLITIVAAAMFGVSMLVAPRRGIIADLVRRALLRRRILTQNLLRSVYERLEPSGDLSLPWRAADVARRAQVVKRAMRAGLVRPSAEGFALTAHGQESARQVVRAHRLWELFLIGEADIAPDHVDRDADQIEHVLPPAVLAQLELKLAESGRLPIVAQIPVPASPHPMSARGAGSK